MSPRTRQTRCGLYFGRERLRTHSIESSGKLKISPEQHWDFTAEDLKDLGEIGRGAYGSVNKMVHKPSNQIMAVKVGLEALLATNGPETRDSYF